MTEQPVRHALGMAGALTRAFIASALTPLFILAALAAGLVALTALVAGAMGWRERRKLRTGDEVNVTGIRFGAQVPVREIVLSCPELSGPDADQ